MLLYVVFWLFWWQLFLVIRDSFSNCATWWIKWETSLLFNVLTALQLPSEGDFCCCWIEGRSQKSSYILNLVSCFWKANDSLPWFCRELAESLTFLYLELGFKSNLLFSFFLALVIFCGHFAYVLSRVNVCTTDLTRSCQSPVWSCWFPLDVPHVKVVKFNIRFTYLEILYMTRDFWFSGAVQQILKSQSECDNGKWQNTAMPV